MHHLVLVAAALLTLAPLHAEGANPCKKPCGKTQAQCFGAATSAFKTTCGFTASHEAPTGAPIIAEFATTPSVTATALMRDGTPVEHCELDQLDALDDIGEQVLAARNAVVIMPKEVLKKGSRYDVSITNGGVVTSWSFTVNCQ